jgi:type IV pilus assembly protein PilB
MASRSSSRKTVKDTLLHAGLINKEDVKKIEEQVHLTQKAFQQAVLDLRLAEKKVILEALAREWHVDSVDFAEKEVDPDIVRVIPEATARRHLAAPFQKDEGVLSVAMVDPRDFFVAEDINLRTGFEVRPFVAMPDDVIAQLDKVYGAGGVRVEDVVKGISEMEEGGGGGGFRLEAVEAKVDVAEVDPTAPEVERLVNAVILGALQLKASDIHIEPFEGKMIVRYRIDGLLREAPFQVPWTFRSALIAKVKIMTNQMDITERRKPQDGRIQVVSKGSPIEFRVNIVPTVFGESCVMRVLDRTNVNVDMDKLGFLPDTLARFKEALQKPYGLILVSGPTGSGKSTTLYAALNSINEPDVKILTAENPVEYNLNGIVQININPEIDFDFAGALRAFLRQDPDIIMVGEIRDKETAQIAMEAAMTGHLVFSTIHTNDAPSAVARLHEMGVPNFLVASTIEAVLAQRLVRRICEKCRKPLELTPEIKVVFEQYHIDFSGATLFKGAGCKMCQGTGYKGRAGIHEFLMMDSELRKLVLKEVAAGPIREIAVKNGMRTLLEDGLIKVTQGLTTIEEVMTVAR